MIEKSEKISGRFVIRNKNSEGLPLHFEAPDVKLRIDQSAIDEAYAEITGDLSEQDRDDLGKRAAKMAKNAKARLYLGLDRVSLNGTDPGKHDS